MQPKLNRLPRALAREGLEPIGPVVASQVEAGIVREVARLAPLMTFKA